MLGNFHDEGNDAFGLEISDLMVTLVSVFLLGSVMMNDTIRYISDGISINQAHVDSVIRQKLGLVAAQYQIELLGDGRIRYNAKFESGKSDVTSNMKKILDSICPNLKEVVLHKRDLIRSVTFEGHTSKKWPESLESTPFYGNKALSYERATKTMKYCLGESFEFDHPELMGKFNAFGYSYSQPVRREDSSINWDASKRVDIVLMAHESFDENKQ